ncbi:ABC protein [Roridomyces roridus]|uniref:ABC protein n=1 Tax=Roridomyces roridus TaxID=1738132 RepID=A0AAD7C908_9AGAR|nr:ABC protein [Roridomyces roridus]
MSRKSQESDTSQTVEDKAVSTAVPKHDLQLDNGDAHVRYRKKWYQLWVPRDPPPPPPASFDDPAVSPYVTASLLSRLTYMWITPMMVLGYQRTLQATDLWKMGPEQKAGTLADQLDASWARRVAAAEAYNARLDAGEVGPGFLRRAAWALPGRDAKALEKQWRDTDGRHAASLAWALNDVFGHLFWRGGVFKVVSDTSQLMGPIIVKSLINFSKDRAQAKAAGEPIEGVGRGVGMAIGLLCILVTASICQHQFFFRSMTTGVLARTALISSLYKRAVRLTPSARVGLSNSALLNHISTDVSRIDAAAQWFHAAWTAPIQVSVCLIILCVQLGAPALAGFALFIVVAPLQQRIMLGQFQMRQASMKFTDARARTILEVLSSMRVVKYFCYEGSFLSRLATIRMAELKKVVRIQNSQSANFALAFSLPVLAATLGFVTYTKTKAGFDVAVVFSSFALFNLLRQPMMFLPRALSAIADSRSALGRLEKVYHAPIRPEGEAFDIDVDMVDAVEVKGASWEWETVASDVEDDKGGKKKGSSKSREADLEKEKEKELEKEVDAKPFSVRNISFSIPRGTLAAVVGRVGSGKSSLLQGLIGEMRCTEGSWKFGGRVAYCPQTAWIQNATLRDNVLFGQPFEEDRYWRVVEDACLLPDLQLLADGDLTEIGEKGINLSGGQKQRVNIARALYYGADVVIFDDPLSAVDANVGKQLFHTAIQGLIAQHKTVILVTHALHFLSQCDYIYTMEGGRIAEAGTYVDLVKRDGEFARLDREFGGAQAQANRHDDDEEEEDAQVQVVSVADAMVRAAAAGAAGTGKLEGKLIVKETRTTGGIAWSVYGYYLKAGGGWLTVPAVILATLLMQGSAAANSYTLVWWENNTFDKSFTFYQVMYALLGISQAAFTFLMGVLMDYFAKSVSRNLHQKALLNVFHAPMSFFDTTPMGRIISIFGKDIDTIDNQLPMSMRMCILIFASVIGSVIVISVVEHYFLIAAAGITIGFGYFAQFYRTSAIEMKRLDAMLRGVLYAHLSESLTGLPTIRSYGEISRFIEDNKYYIDLENRALFLTVTNQRWLAVRLDALGAILVFLIAILSAVGIKGVSAAEIGLILTYITQLTQLFSVITRLSAEVENYMNSVERVVHYARGDAVPQEAAHESTPENKPGADWPTHGAIEFKDVTMAYRPGLPNVLHGISLNIKAGEKIGVVGRTGAGKSSLTLCLLRIVEYQGKIAVDDVDIGKIGLTDLRSNIAIIPQDPTLFSGTVRTALDPFSKYDDARLWDALRRSSLVGTRPSTPAGIAEAEGSAGHGNHKLGLETVLEADGANLSVGERSLLSLARALVKDSRVVILDEATASVDLETDNKIQRTIQTQFRDHTLICIAHRLRTIISYDRILVLDAGRIAEFDTPTNLFNKEASLFRSLCEKSHITLSDIEKAILQDEEEDD